MRKLTIVTTEQGGWLYKVKIDDMEFDKFEFCETYLNKPYMPMTSFSLDKLDGFDVHNFEIDIS